MPLGLPDAAAEKSAGPEPVFLAWDVPGLQHLRRLQAAEEELCTRAAVRFAAQSCGARLAADAAESRELSRARPVLELAALGARLLGPQAALPLVLWESVPVLAAQELALVERAR